MNGVVRRSSFLQGRAPLRLGLVAILLAVLAWRLFPVWQQQGLGAAVGSLGGGLPLDADTKTEIRNYFEGVTIPANEDSISAAIRLDHQQGRPLLAQQRYREAYALYRKVLAISYKHDSMMGISIGLGVISDAFNGAGNLDEAIRAELLAYKVAKAMNNPQEYGVAELALGRLFQQRDRGLSLMWLMRARKSLDGTQNKGDYVALLDDLAAGLETVTKSAAADKIYKEAFDAARTLSGRPDDLRTRWQAGRAYAYSLRQAHRCGAAIKVVNATLSTFAPQQKANSQYKNLLWELAQCESELGHTDAARSAFAEAYLYYQTTRATSLGDTARATLDNNNWGLVNRFVAQLLASGDRYGALALLESNKARTLNDILGDPGQKGVYRAWAEFDRAQAKARRAVFERITKSLPDGTISHQDGYTDLLALVRRQRRERAAAAARREIRAVAARQAMTATDIRVLQARLPASVVVLSAYVTRGGVRLFLLTAKGVEYLDTGLSYAAHRRLAEALFNTLRNPYMDFYLEHARALYDKLLAPAIAKLDPAIKVIVYSPDGLLSRIPLAALHDGKRFVAERYAVLRVPSLRFLKPDQVLSPLHFAAGVSCVDPAIAGARLPFQQATGKALEDDFGERLQSLSGAACSPDALDAALASNRHPEFLHIGAHGIFFPSDAMKSGIFLSTDDTEQPAAFWGANRIGATDLGRMKLVTLSSCETGRTDPKRYRDVFGILRTLFFSGAQRVLAPLWSVIDEPTADLMQGFYKALTDDLPAASALREAQLSLIHSRRFRHPFYWAGFVLVGGPT